MKKVSILILSLFFLTQNPALSAQTGEKQIMIPRSVYVGDTAQLIISFSAKNDFQTGDLLLQNFERPLDSKSYSVKKIILAQNGNASDNQKKYTLTVIFTPWITGEIIIPPYKIGKDFIVYPSPVTIESILTTEKGHKTFVDNKGPLFIPGTTYRILFRLIFLILLAIILIILFCRRKNLSVKYKNFKLRILYSKNKKNTLNELNKLKNSSETDKIKSEKIQTVLRKYLTVRFGYPFGNCTSSEIWKGFDKVFQGLLSEEKEDAVENLTGVFVRTDFIRYSVNGIFEKNELYSLITRISLIIETLEGREIQS